MSDIIEKLEKLKQNNLKFEIIKIGAEVLLSSISIDQNGSNVYPANCPGKGRTQDILLDSEGQPACMFRGKPCPYFVSTRFSLEEYDKNIECSVV